MRVHSKKDAGPRFEAFGTPVKTLVERQRILYARAYGIRQANDERSPLSPKLANWLALALYGIACGGDADECLGVKPDKQGVRKDGLLREMQRKNDAGSQFDFSASNAPVTVPLIERQRRLHLYADEIRQTNEENSPLRPKLAVWLAFALRDIALGKNAEECLGVKVEKRGSHKHDFSKQIQRRLAIGYVASVTDDPHPVTNKQAFKQAAILGPAETTVRKNWNKKDADRDPEFSLTDP